jgi:hypothetical protein
MLEMQVDRPCHISETMPVGAIEKCCGYKYQWGYWVSIRPTHFLTRSCRSAVSLMAHRTARLIFCSSSLSFGSSRTVGSSCDSSLLASDFRLLFCAVPIRTFFARLYIMSMRQTSLTLRTEEEESRAWTSFPNLSARFTS